MITQSLSQKLSLQQKLSPQQVLLSTLLQLPTLALEQKLKTELEINPLLELEEEELLETEEEMDQELEQENEEDEEDEKYDEESDTEEISENNEIEWDTILNDEDYFEVKRPVDRPEERLENPEVNIQTLYEHLLDQLHLLTLTDQEIEIGEYIIWNIDEDGYLACPVDIIARNLSVDVEEVEEILMIVQGFEPQGIAARDLKECLLIQLKAQKPENRLAIRMIEEKFDEFKNKKFEKLVNDLEITLGEVKETMDIISKLDPKPGEGYFDPNQNYVIPDIVIEKVDDEFEIVLNDRHVPRLRINEAYRKLLFDKKNEDKTKEYIQNKLESARWLINSIHQRRMTILKVVTSIVNRQIDFFEKGPGHLKPMVLKDIADDIHMDISTISRATSNKYAQTDYGVFSMKYFFAERMITEDGKEISTRKVKSRLKEIIQSETPQKPYTDSQLEKLLKEDGFPIARRTIAKYREQMVIPSARMRRQI